MRKGADMEKRKTVRGMWEGGGAGAASVRFALNPLSRARGLFARGDFEGMLVIAPCRDIHTMGMRRPIDVAFVDACGTILEAHRRVGPFRRLRNRQAVCVIERISRCESPWFRQGERLALSGMRNAAEGGGRR